MNDEAIYRDAWGRTFVNRVLAGLDEDVAQKAADEVAREAVQRFSYAKMQIAIEDRNKGEEP